MSELVISSTNFEKEVMKSDLPVLIDFWADWCGPCRMMAPVVSNIAEKYEGKIKVGKINVDNEPELANAFRIDSIPKFILIENGQIVSSFVGYHTQEEAESLLKLK